MRKFRQQAIYVLHNMYFGVLSFRYVFLTNQNIEYVAAGFMDLFKKIQKNL